jgi:hypothetical protein
MRYCRKNPGQKTMSANYVRNAAFRHPAAIRRRLNRAVPVNGPFTAADEKIPLSVGHVNSKPQYLVF